MRVCAFGVAVQNDMAWISLFNWAFGYYKCEFMLLAMLSSPFKAWMYCIVLVLFFSCMLLSLVMQSRATRLGLNLLSLLFGAVYVPFVVQSRMQCALSHEAGVALICLHCTV